MKKLWFYVLFTLNSIYLLNAQTDPYFWKVSDFVYLNFTDNKLDVIKFKENPMNVPIILDAKKPSGLFYSYGFLGILNENNNCQCACDNSHYRIYIQHRTIKENLFYIDAIDGIYTNILFDPLKKTCKELRNDIDASLNNIYCYFPCSNKEDWWIIASDGLLSKYSYRKYQMKPGGIEYIGSGQTNFNFSNSDFSYFEYYTYNELKSELYNLIDSTLHQFTFNKSSGDISLTYSVNIGKEGHISISPNGNWLYVVDSISNRSTQLTDFFIYQFDLTKINNPQEMRSSKNQIASFLNVANSPGTPYVTIRKAPDGKIYLFTLHANNPYLSVIEKPNEEGLACSFKKNVMDIGTTWAVFPLVYIDTYANFTFTIDCNSRVSFITASSSFSSIQWSFGDGTTSAESKPSHTYTKAGKYNVQATVTFTDGTTLTTTKEIEIKPKLNKLIEHK
jgi:PKD repeat protein